MECMGEVHTSEKRISSGRDDVKVVFENGSLCVLLQKQELQGSEDKDVTGK